MAERTNPYGLKVDLHPDDMLVTVILRKKDEKGEPQEVGSEAFSYEDVPDDLKPNVNLYGLSKFIQDRSSQVSAGPDKLAALQEVYAQLLAGNWEKERVVGAPTVSPEVEALAQLKGITIPQAQKALRNHTKEQREKILAHPKIKELADQLRSARQEEEVADLSDLAA